MRDMSDSALSRAKEILGEPLGNKQGYVKQSTAGQTDITARHALQLGTEVWWVNQGNTFDAARKSGQIFAPLEDKLGREPVHWKSVAEVKVGDILVHCAGGQIRALGRAISGPIEDSRPVGTTDPSVPEWNQTGRRVDVDYFDLAPPITVSAIADEIRAQNIPQGPFSTDGGLKQGYLFRFSGTGLRALREASKSEWPTWAVTFLNNAPPGPEMPCELEKVALESGLEALLSELDLAGLHFSREIVSNYLLALQTKRFVILTGISGTGKTQLALVIANHFRQFVSVPQAPALSDDSLVVAVQPYMLKYRRMVLPAAFTADLALPDPSLDAKLRQIRVSYPGGEQMLTLAKDPSRNVTFLLFKGPFRKWFVDKFIVGDQFAIEPFVTNVATFSGIRFHQPTIEQKQELLESYLVTSVRPDWSDNRGLLGYFNPLLGSYVVTPFLRLLLDASGEVDRAAREGRKPAPFFVILDEMNLARVEHYFSDFLSALESGEPIHLHDHPGVEEGQTEDAVPVPRQLRVPENVFFTGTVNVDETTYMFSPKVLDRAFTIELNRVELATFGNVDPEHSPSFALHRFPGYLGPAPKPTSADWVQFGGLLGGELRQVVLDLHELLSDEDRHFGYRVANEIARFVVLASEQTDGTEPELWTALDLAVLEKVLPKFHGTQQELESVLSRLIEFVELRPLPRTAGKIKSMQRRLVRQGFTSFIE